MRYLTLAEAVTGTSSAVLARASRLDLLDSALHAPQAGFGDLESYPDFANKAAVLTVRMLRCCAPLWTGRQADKTPHRVRRGPMFQERPLAWAT